MIRRWFRRWRRRPMNMGQAWVERYHREAGR